jgi:hypothetical protein
VAVKFSFLWYLGFVGAGGCLENIVDKWSGYLDFECNSKYLELWILPIGEIQEVDIYR